MKEKLDLIDLDLTDNLHQLFLDRVSRSPDKVAYRYYDKDTEGWESSTWSEIAAEVASWQAAFIAEELEAGDTVGIMLRNCKEWVILDQAAMSLGLVVVPLYTDDRPDNVSYILNDANVQLLLIEGGEQWNILYEPLKSVIGLKRILTLEPMTGAPHDPRLRWVNDWLDAETHELRTVNVRHDELATIVYTSGTTGRPKGVMLSHHNILWNVKASLSLVRLYTSDTLISFLPLSHTLERTAGYYMSMCAGSTVAYARSVQDLGEDMMTIRPTILITVPRIFERVYNKIYEQLEQKSGIARTLFHDAVAVGYAHFLYRQRKTGWRASFLMRPLLKTLVSKKILAKFGGRIRLCISGGAALSPAVAHTFIGLGLNILQGYGLTEHSPVISVNTLRDNVPDSVGIPLPGVETRISDQGELLVRSPSVMLGYLNNHDATEEVLDEEGWLYTGDKVEIRNKHIHITGRLKEIIVMSNGEKIPPGDMEMAILEDPVIEQVMLIGEHRPYLSALVVVNMDAWKPVASVHHIDWLEPPIEQQREILLKRIGEQLKEFPGYAQVHQLTVCEQPWTIENAMLTPTLKLRRKQINAKHAAEIDEMYHGH